MQLVQVWACPAFEPGLLACPAFEPGLLACWPAGLPGL
jgi:hypothetical protein